jgi:hypothetical protein
VTAIKSRRVVQVSAVLVILVCALYVLLLPKRGKVIESWQTGNNAFRIRVTAYSEKPSLPGLGGAYYVFDSATVSSDKWGEALTFRHDTPVEIPRNQVRLVNDQVGYVFMGWMYSVTTDGGSSWHIWSADKDLPSWQCCNYNLIQDVRIAPDGTGTMKLNPIPQRRGEVPELHTKDYGRHWSVE